MARTSGDNEPQPEHKDPADTAKRATGGRHPKAEDAEASPPDASSLPEEDGWTQELKRELKQRAKERSLWVRLAFMVLSAAIFVVVYAWLFWFVVIFQFLYKLLTGKVNAALLSASERLVSYAGDILSFLLYRTERPPWPFGTTQPEE